MIFDTHSHYDDRAFDGDRDDILNSFNENGISGAVAVAAEWDSFEKILEICRKYDFMYPALGIHPNNALDLTPERRKEFEALVKQVKPVAIGEIGLEYHYEEPDREIQKEAFIYQLQVAKENNLPVIIHSRDAAEDTMNILKAHPVPKNGVIHCFSSSAEMAEEYVKMGYYIGIGGVVTFKNAKKLKEVAAAVPLERILLETDCPYLAPTPFRGERNSSLLLPYVVKEIADLKGISTEEVEKVTEENARRFYRI